MPPICSLSLEDFRKEYYLYFLSRKEVVVLLRISFLSILIYGDLFELKIPAYIVVQKLFFMICIHMILAKGFQLYVFKF
jgi:hypothetical protein